jgi:hypothetical protein
MESLAIFPMLGTMGERIDGIRMSRKYTLPKKIYARWATKSNAIDFDLLVMGPVLRKTITIRNHDKMLQRW